jgi:hypothetical protein
MLCYFSWMRSRDCRSLPFVTLSELRHFVGEDPVGGTTADGQAYLTITKKSIVNKPVHSMPAGAQDRRGCADGEFTGGG